MPLSVCVCSVSSARQTILTPRDRSRSALPPAQPLQVERFVWRSAHLPHSGAQVAPAAGDGARPLLPSAESAVHAAVETLGDSLRAAPRRVGGSLRGAVRILGEGSPTRCRALPRLRDPGDGVCPPALRLVPAREAADLLVPDAATVPVVRGQAGSDLRESRNAGSDRARIRTFSRARITCASCRRG